MAPMLGKQEWRCCSSQPTPRVAKVLALEPPSLFVEPQEKNINVSSLAFHRCLIPVQCQPPFAYGHTNLQYYAQDLVIYEPPSLQHSTRSCDLILGNGASCILSSHSVVFATCLFPLVGQQTLFNNYIHSCPPLAYFIK